jgi:hypothetical protein
MSWDDVAQSYANLGWGEEGIGIAEIARDCRHRHDGGNFSWPGGFVLMRFLRSMLFEVGAADPLTFAAVALLLSVVALLASYLPGRCATKVGPMAALRYE